MPIVPPTREQVSIPADGQAETIERDLHSTIVPTSTASIEPPAPIDRRLELFETIGQGGMGLVRRGTQHALGREVAVKGLKPGYKNARSASKLLREARVTGGLEHPNIIPVYEISEEDDGTPLIVLKKVEGVDWGALMHDGDAVHDRFGTDDLLEWNLRILIQVCNVVSFAHSRRVLHRDLKPSNVMIGAFGEVYVLDWGIAVALDDRPNALLPRASEASELAGTPVYMAPEMLGGRAGLLSERTDVYLLGAMLYEIVTSRPPHVGTSLPEIIRSVLGDDPEIPESVPAELARILRRALDRDASARFESAEQLRHALEDFLRYRTASELARHAEERLAVLLAQLEDPSADREEVYRLYGECRFGLRHALEAWPGSESVRRSLELATVGMVELELRHGGAQAARVLLRDLDTVPPELEARVAAREAERANEYDELRRLRADLDPQSGRTVRQLGLALLGAIWVLYPLGVEAARVNEHWSFSPAAAAVVASFVLVVLLSILFIGRKTVLVTAINRRLAAAAVLTTVLHIADLAVFRGTPILLVLQERLLSACAIVAMLGASVHPGLFVSAASYLVLYLATAYFGAETVLYATSVGNAILFGNLFFVLSTRVGNEKT